MSRVKLSEVIAPCFFFVHHAARKDKFSHYWLKGGRASGKSSFISVELIQGILRDKAAHAIVFRKVGNTLPYTVVAQCKWAIERLGLNGFWHHQKSPQELIYLPTGQRILFKGCDDADKSKGIKLQDGYFKYLWFEELSEFEGMEEVDTVVRSVVRGGGHTNIFYSYNPPKSAQNWVNAAASEPRAGRLIHHSTYLDVPRRWLGEQFIREAEATREMDELRYRWAYLGEACGSGGNVFDNVVVRAITQEEILRLDRIYDGLDFGFAVDPAAFVMVAWEAQARRLWVLEEYCKVGASYDTLAREILQRQHGVRRMVTADSSEPRSIAELHGRGVTIAGARKGPGSREHGFRWLQDLREIIIDAARTPNAAREFCGYEYAIDGMGNFKAQYPDGNDHVIDAVRYALEDVMARRSVEGVRGLRI